MRVSWCRRSASAACQPTLPPASALRSVDCFPCLVGPFPAALLPFLPPRRSLRRTKGSRARVGVWYPSSQTEHGRALAAYICAPRLQTETDRVRERQRQSQRERERERGRERQRERQRESPRETEREPERDRERERERLRRYIFWKFFRIPSGIWWAKMTALCGCRQPARKPSVSFTLSVSGRASMSSTAMKSDTSFGKAPSAI